jgi:predicted PurR-regulated permease PerM
VPRGDAFQIDIRGETMMNSQDSAKQDITRTTLAVLFIGILIAASFWILRPFLTSIIWATIIVVATWPVLLRLQKMLRGRRRYAVAVMTFLLFMILVLPLFGAIAAIAVKSDDIASWIRSLSGFSVPQPPEWVKNIPLAGGKLAERWMQYAALTPEELTSRLTPYARAMFIWFMNHAGSIAGVMFQFVLTGIISGILYASGERAASGVLAFGKRLTGKRGEEVMILAAKATRGVAIGIVGTALIQTALSCTGLFISGIPAAPLLTAVVFVLCLAQIGPILVMLPSVVWLYWKGDPLWGTVLLVFSVLAVTIDNFLRPVFIKKGVDLPLILIFAGVIGGLIAFGVIGLFIGPVVLAVTHTLLKSWVYSGDDSRLKCGPDRA